MTEPISDAEKNALRDMDWFAIQKADESTLYHKIQGLITRCDQAEQQNKKLRSFIQELLDNEPDDMVSDCHTLLELWRHDVRKALADE